MILRTVVYCVTKQIRVFNQCSVNQESPKHRNIIPGGSGQISHIFFLQHFPRRHFSALQQTKILCKIWPCKFSSMYLQCVYFRRRMCMCIYAKAPHQVTSTKTPHHVTHSHKLLHIQTFRQVHSRISDLQS